MKFYFLNDFVSENPDNKPQIVTFYSPGYADERGEQTQKIITVHLADGDVQGLMSDVIANHGIGSKEADGSLIFIPWPCAAVTVRVDQ